MDLFGDQRKVPQISINVKVRLDNLDYHETKVWNSVFGYIMKKPRTKLDFLIASTLRNLDLHRVKLRDIIPYISETDYSHLKAVEDIFDFKLTTDIKAFILAILKINTNTVLNILDN